MFTSKPLSGFKHFFVFKPWDDSNWLSHFRDGLEITSRIIIIIIIIVIIIIIIIIQPCRGCLWTCERFSKHLWPLQNQQKAGNHGCGSRRSTNVWGLEASPHCLFHGALPWTTCPLEPLSERIVLRGVQNWVVADCTNDVLECGSMTLFDTWDLVVTVCM